MTRTGKIQKVIPGPGPLDIVPIRTPAAVHEALTPVVFKGTGGYIVTGPESQQVYCFSSHDPEQMVDARDAEALLRTGLFAVNN